MTWIKPAVRWSHVKSGQIAGATLCSRRIADSVWGRKDVLKVVVIPYTVARKAGMLRRPK